MSHKSWNRVPLTAVCANADDIKCGPFGTQLNKDEFRTEGVPLWGIKQVNGNFAIPTKEFLELRTAKRLQQYDLKAGDIVMTRKGTVGNCAVYPAQFEAGIMHSDLLRLRVDAARCEPTFLIHQLHHSPDVERQLSLISGGAIMPGINVGRLKQLEVVLPPLAEQRRIAEILDKADALRAKRRAALAQLDTLTQSIFLDMFGDPATNPKRFPTTRLRNLCMRITDGTHQPPKWSPSGHPFLFVSNVITGEITFDTQKCISDETHAELTRRCPIEVGDVLYSTVGSYGIPAVVRTKRKFAFQRHIAHLKPNRDLLNPDFLHAMLASPPLRRQADRVARGVAQKTVNLAAIQEFVVFAPSLELQQEFARRAAGIERLRSAHRTSLAELDSLFASLQHRAFRGEL